MQQIGDAPPPLWAYNPPSHSTLCSDPEDCNSGSSPLPPAFDCKQARGVTTSDGGESEGWYNTVSITPFLDEQAKYSAIPLPCLTTSSKQAKRCILGDEEMFQHLSLTCLEEGGGGKGGRIFWARNRYTKQPD